MGKRSGEPEHYNVCERCKKLVTMEEKVNIRYGQYYRPTDYYPTISSNHKLKVLDSFNLCPDCFKYINEIVNKELCCTSFSNL